ncbi:galacturonosyltransferase 6 [Striga asiatica]|uniref:Galacturonosyltransferase 6 n=1 Tax=Striga asiatica TaxID=4170 RepID=A0A5A7Q294_STRAF|nr:galacturonosyltransferase 6 [Striga asiatica]
MVKAGKHGNSIGGREPALRVLYRFRSYVRPTSHRRGGSPSIEEPVEPLFPGNLATLRFSGTGRIGPGLRFITITPKAFSSLLKLSREYQMLTVTKVTLPTFGGRGANEFIRTA